ncbi:hypothetical protein [Bacillus sp. V5-8f]|uniref:hypothetical protein n=1 Tax=Bacillus sp. V5-8f TaxID=2053044 RepID=UPI000C777E6E|nr:hypothetical protein [Bacillus sp. V5-8f]PLT32163.1 hypothetical protein CUU64_20320 [Bacillus sp. V5-8f]
MKYNFASDAVDVLSQLFFKRTTKHEYLAMSTAQFYIEELRLLEDTEAVAHAIENHEAWALIPIFRLFDNRACDDIECNLSGKVYL